MSISFSQLLDIALDLQRRGQTWVLATVIHTAGVTSYTAGSRTLITEDGRFCGRPGGNAVRRKLLAEARAMSAENTVTVVHYDTGSNGDWEMGLGAGATVTFLLQRITGEQALQPFIAAGNRLQNNAAEVLATVCESTWSVLPPGMTFPAREPGSRVVEEVRDDIRATAAAIDTPCMLIDHTWESHTVTIVYTALGTPPHLLAIGADPGARALADLARCAGWRVSIVADEQTGAREYPAAAGEVPLLSPATLAKTVALTTVDAVLLLAGDFASEREYLRVIAATDIPYVGVTGPPLRQAALVDALGETGKNLHGRLHGADTTTPLQLALEFAAAMCASPDDSAGGGKANTAATDTTTTEHLHGVILAAGGSRRYGGFKQLLEVGGRSLLRRATDAAYSHLHDRVVVVLGPKPTKCERELRDFSVTTVTNRDWESGMASSIHRGIRALPDDCQAVLFLLCDQALITAAEAGMLIAAWCDNPGAIVASQYADVIGVPAIFPRRFFPELLALSGDRGAKSVIESHQKQVLSVDIPEAAVDIDTEDDYARLLTRG